MADEGLRFEAWTMPHVGALTRKFDFTKLFELYTLNDRYNDLCDGTLTIPDDAALRDGSLLKNKLLYIDEANHTLDVGSMIRVLRGETPIMHFITTRSEDSWSDGEPTTKLTIEGLEWILDRALVPNFDSPADPTVDPDWIYGADSVLKNSGLEESGQSLEVQLLWLDGTTGGTFTLTYSGQTTSAINWNADWFAVGNALEALSNIQDVTVSGAGTGTSPWTVEFIDPDGDVAAITFNIGSLTGPAPLGHVETTLPGGQSDTAGWTTSFNPSTGEPHGTYQNFQVSTAQAHTGTYSLLVNAAAPANPADFPGAQQILNVTPGRTYRAEVWVYPTFTSTFTLVIRTMDETWIAESAGSGTPLTANTWNLLTIDPFVMPDWIDQIIFRVGLKDSTDQGDWYIDDAVLAPGFPAATIGTMMSDIRTAAVAGGVLTWLTPTWTTTLDSDGVAWDQNRQWNVNHGQTFLQLFEYARKWNYEFRLRWDVADNRFEWDMWNPSGGGQVRANIAITGKAGVMGSAPIVRRPPNATYMKTEGSLGRWGEYASTTLDDVWGRLEKFHQDRQGVNSDELDVLAERLIIKGTENTAARTVTVSDPSLLPWTAYEPGDVVTLNLAPKDVKKELRVAAIVVSKGPNDAAPIYDVHFGAVVYSNDTAIASGLRTLIREFKRPVFNPPAAVPLPEVPPPLPTGGSAPTLVIAASNAPDSSKARADYICTGIGDNATFNTAISQLAAAQGGRLLLTEGDYNFSGTVTLSSATPIFPSYRIEGMGMKATRINMAAAANAYMFSLTATFNGTLEFSNLELDGAKATQTSGTWAGIYLAPNGSPGELVVDHCLINNMRGHGIFSDRSSWKVTVASSVVRDNSLNGLYLFVEGSFMVTNSYISLNGNHGIFADGASVVLTGNWISSNTWDGYSAGGIFHTAGVRVVFIGNHIFSNRTGIRTDGGNAVILGNHIGSNTNHGLEFQTIAGRPISVVGNVFYNNTQRGMYLFGDGGGTASDNTVVRNGQDGIYVGGKHWNVNGNRVESNGQTTNNTYDGIAFISGADHCAALTNVIRQDTSSNKQRYGVNVRSGATCCKVAGNDLGDPATYGTGAFVDAGTTTEKRWPNDSFYGDNFTVCGAPSVPDEVVGGPDDITAPAVPTGFAAAPGDTFIQLTWTDNSELDLASYEIYRATAASGGPYTFLVSVVEASAYTNTGLTNGSSYWYKIAAKDTTGNESAQSAFVTAVPAVPAAGVAPAVPTGLSVDVGDTELELDWTDNTETDMASYNVYWATASGGPFTLLVNRTVSNYTATGLTNGTAYWFKVSAVDTGANESAQSSSVTASPAADTPPAGLPAIDVIFNSGNLYTEAKVNAEAAGTCFQFTITGGTSSGPRYENAAIPTKAGNQYVFDVGTVLDGNGSVPLAFTGTAIDVEIYDCEWTAYQGQNSSGSNNVKGGGGIRCRAGWQIIRPYGHHNKYTALRFDGANCYVEDGDLSYNGEFGFAGTSSGGQVIGTEVHHNGGGVGLDLGGDQGGCKIVHSDGFLFTDINAHDNLGTSTQGGNGLWSDINNINTVYDNCTLSNNAGAGIFHEVSLSFEIKNCDFTNNGRDYATANPGSLWPVSAQIQISNSGGNLGWIHDNTITVTTGTKGFHGITIFNSAHFQWTNGVISNGCLGTRNLLIEDNTINMSGSQWKSAVAITGTLPTSRSGDQFCGQLEITAAGSNNRIRNNSETLSGGANSTTPYLRSGVRVSAAGWAGFGYT